MGSISPSEFEDILEVKAQLQTYFEKGLLCPCVKDGKFLSFDEHFKNQYEAYIETLPRKSYIIFVQGSGIARGENRIQGVNDYLR